MHNFLGRRRAERAADAVPDGAAPAAPDFYDPATRNTPSPTPSTATSISSHALHRITKLRHMRVHKPWASGKSQASHEAAAAHASEPATTPEPAGSQDAPRTPSSPFSGQRASFSALRRSLEKGSRTSSILTTRGSDDQGSAIDASDLVKAPISLGVSMPPAEDEAGAATEEMLPLENGTPIETSSAQAYVPASESAAPVLPPVETSPLHTPSFQGSAQATPDPAHSPNEPEAASHAPLTASQDAEKVAEPSGAAPALHAAAPLAAGRTDTTQALGALDEAPHDGAPHADDASRTRTGAASPVASPTEAPSAAPAMSPRLPGSPITGAPTASPASTHTRTGSERNAATSDVGTPAAALPTLPYSGAGQGSGIGTPVLSPQMPWSTSPSTTRMSPEAPATASLPASAPTPATPSEAPSTPSAPSADATPRDAREPPALPRATSAAELPRLATPEPDAPGSSMLGAIGKRGWDMVRGWRQPLPSVRKNVSNARLETQKGEPRRRSIFSPALHGGARQDAPQRSTSVTPTRLWLDWLESGSPSASTSGTRGRLRGLRSSSSMLSTSTSMQSLRLSPRLTEDGKVPTPLFGMPLGEAVVATRLATPSAPPATLPSRAEAQRTLLPRIVTRCIQSLEKWGMDEEGVYRISGRSSHSSRLRAFWDTPGADLDMTAVSPADLDVHSVCSVLKMYLRELPERLVPVEVAAEMDRMVGEHSAGDRAPASAEAAELRSSELVLRDASSAEALIERLAPFMARIPAAQWYLLRELAEHLGLLIDPPTVARTKMPLSNLTLVLAPTLQVPGTLFMALVQFRHRLFTETNLPMENALEAHRLSPIEMEPPAQPAQPAQPAHAPSTSSADEAPSKGSPPEPQAQPALTPIADRFAQPHSELLGGGTGPAAPPAPADAPDAEAPEAAAAPEAGASPPEETSVSDADMHAESRAETYAEAPEALDRSAAPDAAPSEPETPAPEASAPEASAPEASVPEVPRAEAPAASAAAPSPEPPGTPSVPAAAPDEAPPTDEAPPASASRDPPP